MAVGDSILAAGQAERLFAVDPSRRVAICACDGTPYWDPIFDGNPILARPEAIASGEVVQRLISGPGCRPYIVYPFTEDTGWTFNKAFKARENIAKIYLTAYEVARGTSALAKYGPYVLIEPFSKHINLRWPLDSWTELVSSRPDLTFVQHVHKHSTPIPGAQYEEATFREACGLVFSSTVYIRSESGMLHAAAALGCRTIAIWGGCMDWNVLGKYPKQYGIVDYGPDSPCGRWRVCDHCRQVMAGIRVHRVLRALETQEMMAKREQAELRFAGLVAH